MRQLISPMIEAMWNQQSDAITLGSWYIFECSSGKFGHVDPMAVCGEDDADTADHWLYGYGFSYVFSRAAALQNPYPDSSFGEDWKFFEQIRLRNLKGGKPCLLDPAGVALLHDTCGLCLHTLHATSTSGSYAQREVPKEESEALEVSDLGEVLRAYLH